MLLIPEVVSACGQARRWREARFGLGALRVLTQVTLGDPSRVIKVLRVLQGLGFRDSTKFGVQGSGK